MQAHTCRWDQLYTTEGEKGSTQLSLFWEARKVSKLGQFN